MILAGDLTPPLVANRRAGDLTDVVEAPLKSSFATLAFLVVLRVLIKLFFSIDIVFTRLSLKFLTADVPRREHGLCQTTFGWAGAGGD